MPYNWTHPPGSKTPELHLWPHQSLPPKGFAGFVLATSLMLSLPLFAVLGTVALWGVLPFLVLAFWGLWTALGRSRKNAQILEVLTLSGTHAHLVRHNPRGGIQEWDSNRYWVVPRLHQRGGPVPNYVTLKGEGREVEIGAFLSEEERLALYDELNRTLRAA